MTDLDTRDDGPGHQDAGSAGTPPWWASVGLDQVLPWAGAAMVAAATWQSLSVLIRGVFAAWAFASFNTFVFPNGYYSLALLTGTLLVLWAQARGRAQMSPRWVTALCTVAVAEGVLLVVSQVIGAIDAIFYVSIGTTAGHPLPPLPPGVSVRGVNVFTGLDALGDAVPAALAVIAAALIRQRALDSRVPAEADRTGTLSPWRWMLAAGLIGFTVYVVLAILMQSGGRSH